MFNYNTNLPLIRNSIKAGDASLLQKRRINCNLIDFGVDLV